MSREAYHSSPIEETRGARYPKRLQPEVPTLPTVDRSPSRDFVKGNSTGIEQLLVSIFVISILTRFFVVYRKRTVVEMIFRSEHVKILHSFTVNFNVPFTICWWVRHDSLSFSAHKTVINFILFPLNWVLGSQNRRESAAGRFIYFYKRKET